MNGDILLIILFAPILLLCVITIRDLYKWWRLEVDGYHKWWTWIRFVEPEPGQRNHLAKGRIYKARWCVFRLEDKQTCRFRLPFGMSFLGAIGQISWNEHEIRVEGRVSRLTLATPGILAAWAAGVSGIIYVRYDHELTPWPLFVLVGGATLFTFVFLGGIYLVQGVFERVYFRRAYREIRSRIWQAEQN